MEIGASSTGERTGAAVVPPHDFHLFTDASSGEDAVVYTGTDGVLALKRGGGGGYAEPLRLDSDPVPTLSLDAAAERLNVSAEPFVFFLDERTGQGLALYRRYDGHYGLLSAFAPRP